MTTTIDALEKIHSIASSSTIVSIQDAAEILYSVSALTSSALARARAEQAEPVVTVADESQEWAGMSGNQAWHLIFRHADGWGDIDKMMEEWRAANTPPAAPAKLEPLSAEEIAEPFKPFRTSASAAFVEGVRFAEAAHNAKLGGGG